MSCVVATDEVGDEGDDDDDYVPHSKSTKGKGTSSMGSSSYVAINS